VHVHEIIISLVSNTCRGKFALKRKILTAVIIEVVVAVLASDLNALVAFEEVWQTPILQGESTALKMQSLSMKVISATSVESRQTETVPAMAASSVTVMYSFGAMLVAKA